MRSASQSILVCINCECLSKDLYSLLLNLILLPQLIHPLNIYPSPVYQLLNVNWSAFMEDILLTLKNHDRKNGANGGHYLGCRDLKLLPMLAGCLCDLVVWYRPLCDCFLVFKLLQPWNRGYFHLPPHCTISIPPSCYIVLISLYSGKHWWI